MKKMNQPPRSTSAKQEMNVTVWPQAAEVRPLQGLSRMGALLIAVVLFCLSGCVVTPATQDNRSGNDRRVYDNDRPRTYDADASDINQRIAEMNQRIDQGMRSGALTRDEGRMLRGELNKVRDDAARMKRDGILTPREKDRLHAELDRLKRDIYREARDDDRRRGGQVDISDINRRIGEMDQRIDQGMRSGALTRDEGR
ncbi:hypothetical protein EG832_03930, partial [bacterium]|nr:hypothetical protein [bacterium]